MELLEILKHGSRALQKKMLHARAVHLVAEYIAMPTSDSLLQD